MFRASAFYMILIYCYGYYDYDIRLIVGSNNVFQKCTIPAVANWVNIQLSRSYNIQSLSPTNLKVSGGGSGMQYPWYVRMSSAAYVTPDSTPVSVWCRGHIWFLGHWQTVLGLTSSMCSWRRRTLNSLQGSLREHRSLWK